MALRFLAFVLIAGLGVQSIPSIARAQSLESYMLGNYQQSSPLVPPARQESIESPWDLVGETSSTVPTLATLRQVLERGRRALARSQEYRKQASTPLAPVVTQDPRFLTAMSTPAVLATPAFPSVETIQDALARWLVVSAMKAVEETKYESEQYIAATDDALNCGALSLAKNQAESAARYINSGYRRLRVSNQLFILAPALQTGAREIASNVAAYKVFLPGLKIAVTYALTMVGAPPELSYAITNGGGVYLDYQLNKDLEGEFEARKKLIVSSLTSAIMIAPVDVSKFMSPEALQKLVVLGVAEPSGKTTLEELTKYGGTHAFGQSLIPQAMNEAFTQPAVRDAFVGGAADLMGFSSKKDAEKALELFQEKILGFFQEGGESTSMKQMERLRETFRSCSQEWQQLQMRSPQAVSSAPVVALPAKTTPPAAPAIAPAIMRPTPVVPTVVVAPAPPSSPAPAPVIQSPAPPAPTPPPAPTFSGNAPGLASANFVCDQRPHIDLQWSRVADADGYVVWRNYDREAFITIPDTSFRDESVNSGSTYEYWVIAESRGVKGKISNSITVKVPECSMFAAKLPAYPVGAGPYLAKTGDINGDGHADIVTVSYNDGGVSVLLGDGKGAFQHVITASAGLMPNQLQVFDVNVDGLDDVVVSNSNGETRVLLADRDGSLKKSQSITGYVYAAADFNNDHRTDLFGALGTSAWMWRNAALKNNGTGTFDEVTAWRRSEQVLENAAAGDMNNDGNADVIVVVPAQKGHAVYLPGKGDGTFGAPQDRSLMDNGTVMFSQVAHFTPGYADAVISTGVTFTLLAGGPNGPSTQPAQLATGLDPAGSALVNEIAFADFNGDAKDDMIIPDPTNGRVRIALTRSAPGDNVLATIPVGARPVAAAVADFNEDGKLDIAVVNNGANTVSVLLAGDAFTVPQAPPQTSASGGVGVPTGSVGTTPAVAIRPADLFGPTVNYAVGGPPLSMTSGDFNGDGIKDIATANYKDNTISVLLGKGDGTFAPQVTTPTGRMPYGIFAGNLNNDGKDDLIVGDSYENNYALISNGKGSFTQSTVMRGYIQAAGDFNKDGVMDAFLGGNDNRVYLGNGDGTLRLSPWKRTSWMVGNAKVGDFNGDGKMDVVGTGDPWPQSSDRRPVTLLLGNGDGTFDAGHEWDTPKRARGQWTAVGDLNGDGKIDVVVAHKALSALVGYGDGTFALSVEFQIGTDARTSTGDMFVETGDLNGDGKDDIVVPNGADGTVMFALTGTAPGDGGIGTYPVGKNPIPLLVADFNNDGAKDLASGNANDYTVSIILARPRPKVAAPTAASGGVGVPTASVGIAPAAPVAAPVAAVPAPAAVPVAPVILAPPPPVLPFPDSFRVATNYAVGSSPQSITSGDFNGDGLKDIAVANYTGNSISILMAKNDGTFANAATTPVGRATFGIYAGNINGDKKDDLIVGDSYEKNYALVSNGNGTFTQTAVLPGYVQAAGDINGDGLLDIFVGGNDNRVYLGKGDGTFRDSGWRRTSWMLGHVVLADVNNDGKIDAVGSADPWPQQSSRRPIVVLLGKGDGTFDNGHEYDIASPHRMQAIAVGDVTGDGNLDIIVNHQTISVLAGDGKGGFAAATDVTVGGSDRAATGDLAVAVADLDGDGKAEILVTDPPAGKVWVKRMGGDQAVASFLVDKYPIALGVADLNGDGKPDVFASNANGNSVSVLL